MKKIFFASPVYQNYGIAVVRIITGILLVYHGWEIFDDEKMKMYSGWFAEKKYANPGLWSYSGKFAELIAGIGFVLGLFTRLSALVAIAAFTGIIFLLGDKGNIFQGDQHPFLFILLSVIFIFTGGGFMSFDNLIFKRKEGTGINEKHR